jgi:hypothetical protein
MAGHHLLLWWFKLLQRKITISDYDANWIRDLPVSRKRIIINFSMKMHCFLKKKIIIKSCRESSRV